MPSLIFFGGLFGMESYMVSSFDLSENGDS